MITLNQAMLLKQQAEAAAPFEEILDEKIRDAIAQRRYVKIAVDIGNDLVAAEVITARYRGAGWSVDCKDMGGDRMMSPVCMTVTIDLSVLDQRPATWPAPLPTQ